MEPISRSQQTPNFKPFSPIVELPREILEIIFSYTPISCARPLIKTCKKFNSIVKTSKVVNISWYNQELSVHKKQISEKKFEIKIEEDDPRARLISERREAIKFYMQAEPIRGNKELPEIIEARKRIKKQKGFIMHR